MAPALGLREHALVAIGGGKDSLVSIEALRALGVEQTVTWIGGSQLIKACAERTGLPTLNIGRALAPQLFDYNREGAWNGHIPVTAVNSAIMVFAALLHGVDQVVFSNERSASYGSLIEGTGEVNHQWSKGWACESAFGDYVQRHVAADLHYYSLLRPLSELAVARQFARTDRYDAHFYSCNRNFHILGERPGQPLVRRLPEVPFRVPRAGAVHAQAAPGRHLRPQPARRSGADRRVTTRCSNTRTTSRSSASAKAANRARRWRRWASVRNGARTRWSSASRARSARNSTQRNCASSRCW